jgi:hypothetical protein
MQRDLNEVYKNDKTTMGHLFENFIAAEIISAVSSVLVMTSLAHC